MRLAEDYFVDAKRLDALKFYRFLSINKYSCYFGILIGFYGHIVGRVGRTICLSCDEFDNFICWIEIFNHDGSIVFLMVNFELVITLATS